MSTCVNLSSCLLFYLSPCTCLLSCLSVLTFLPDTLSTCLHVNLCRHVFFLYFSIYLLSCLSTFLPDTLSSLPISFPACLNFLPDTLSTCLHVNLCRLDFDWSPSASLLSYLSALRLVNLSTFCQPVTCPPVSFLPFYLST